MRRIFRRVHSHAIGHVTQDVWGKGTHRGKKVSSKSTGRKRAKGASSWKTAAAKKAIVSAGRKVAKKKLRQPKTAARKKAAMNDIVLTNNVMAATCSELESASPRAIRSMTDFKKEFRGGK